MLPAALPLLLPMVVCRLEALIASKILVAANDPGVHQPEESQTRGKPQSRRAADQDCTLAAHATPCFVYLPSDSVLCLEK
jgi:hypothetical protein